MTNSEEWYGKMADNENSILKESYGNMTLSSSENNYTTAFGSIFPKPALSLCLEDFAP